MNKNMRTRKWTAASLMIALVISLISGVTTHTSAASAGSLAWMKNYGGSSYEVFKDAVAAPGGGYVAAGYALSTDGDLPGNKGMFDMIIARFDENGNKVWLKNYGGSGSDFLHSITQAPDGGYVATGESSSDDGDLTANQGDEDMVIARFDASGNKIWMKNHGGGRNDYLRGIMEQSGGGFVAVGDSFSAGDDLPGNKGGVDMVVAGFDENGNKAWMKNFGGTGDDSFTDIAPAPGAGFAAVGYSISGDGDIPGSKGRHDMIIAGFDASGNKNWMKNYGGEGNDYLYGVTAGPGGGYVAVGDSTSADEDLPGNKGGQDGVVVRFDGNGGLDWIDHYGGGGTDAFSGVAQAPGGSYVVAGQSNSSDGNLSGNKGGVDMVVARVNMPSPDPLLTAIGIVSPPSKTAYTEGETLNLAGLKVKAIYSDGSEQPVADFTTVPAAGTALTPSNTKVTVSWQGKTAEFSITVSKKQTTEAKLTVTASEGGSVLRLPLFGIGLNAGSGVTVYAMPQTGYRLARWEVTGIPQPASVSPLTFTMPAAEVRVKAVFEKRSPCQITASTEGRGFLLGAPATAYEGTTVTMLAVPLWPLSRLDHWEVNGANAGNGLILSHLVTGDVTIRAIFK